MATFVLIHGGIQGGWVWERVSAHLHDAGHKTYAPTLTGCGELSHLLTRDVGLESHVQDVVNLLEYEDLHDVILVGHSYGAIVVTVVADRAHDRIAHLVIVDGAQPLPGQSMMDLWISGDPQGAEEFDRYVQETGEGWRVIPMDPREFGVTDEADIRWLGDLGLLGTSKRAGVQRYDFVQRLPDGLIRSCTHGNQQIKITVRSQATIECRTIQVYGL